jgi:tryptophan 7-halogenase
MATLVKNSKPIKTVTIVGGGTAGWMTATALCRILGNQNIKITLIESEEIGTVGVGEATFPHIRFFNSKLGINEVDFMSRTKATFKLGIEFRNWGRKGDSYIHAFGPLGTNIAGIPFHHHWARLRAAGLADPIEAYSLPASAARANRFAHPDHNPDTPLGAYSYAYQFDAALYAAFLRDLAEQGGVVRREGKVVKVKQDTENGHVRNVTLDDGTIIEADLFIDCSGFRGLLIEQIMESGYEDWSHWLPCDRAVAMPCATNGPLTPYTRATALDAGWAWRIPLQHRVGNGHVYCSSYLSDEEAQIALTAQMESRPIANPNFLQFQTGKRRRQWIGNVVAIGLSAGFLEPLESTSIHLIQLAIGRLLDFFPDQSWDPLFATEYNRLMDLEYERVRDFLILHYHATQRDDSPFWNYVRTMNIPDSLKEKMSRFRERGIIVNYRGGMFHDPSWIAVYAGQNILPERGDPRCDALDYKEVTSALAAIKASCIAAVQSLPIQSDFIMAIGADAR